MSLEVVVCNFRSVQSNLIYQELIFYFMAEILVDRCWPTLLLYCGMPLRCTLLKQISEYHEHYNSRFGSNV